MKPLTSRARNSMAAFAAAFAAAAAPVLEGLGPRPSPADLARRADWVVRGRVTGIATSPDPHGRISTRVELDLSEIWKGPGTNRLVLRLAGGVLGNRKVTYSGQPDFAFGEEVLVFAVRNPDGEPVTLDMAWGKFSVRPGSSGPVAVSASGEPRSIADLKKDTFLP